MIEKINYKPIIEYIRGTLSNEDKLLNELEDYAKINHIPIIQLESRKLLEIIIKINNPKKILELGTAIGYSSIAMKKAGKEDLIIDTIELSENMADTAVKNIERAGFNNQIRVINGDALEVMMCLNKKYDIIFIDAAKGQYNEFFTECMRLINNNGLIISDNVLYKGVIASEGNIDHKHRTIYKRLRDYLDLICNDKRLETSIIPIGDGMSISYVKQLEESINE